MQQIVSAKLAEGNLNHALVCQATLDLYIREPIEDNPDQQNAPSETQLAAEALDKSSDA